MVALDREEAEFRAHIRSKGRMVIPKEVMDALGIEESSLIRCRISKVAPTVHENSRKGGNEKRSQFTVRKRGDNTSARLYIADACMQRERAHESENDNC